MQEESTLVRNLDTTRDNDAESVLHNNPTLLSYQQQNSTTTAVAAAAGSTLVCNHDTTSTNSTTPVAAAAAAAAAGVSSMTTVGKGDDAENKNARISAVLSESNKSPSHKSSSNINIRDKYSATVPKIPLQEKKRTITKIGSTKKSGKRKSSRHEYIYPRTISQFFEGHGWYQGKVSDERLKGDKRYTVNFEDGEEYYYRIDEINEFVRLKEIPIGDAGYQFLREYEGYFFSCEVEKIIIERQGARNHTLLEEINGEKKDRQCYVSDQRQHNYSLGQIKEWSDLRNADPKKIGEPEYE